MSSISRYIFRQTVVVMLFVTIVLTAVIWLTQSLRFVDMVVNRGLPVTEFLWLAMLIVPRFLAVILPISCFVAVVYVYSKLIGDRELIVLRAAGFSNLRLAHPALVVAALTAAAIYVLNAYLLPVSYREFTDLRYEIRSDYSSILLHEGAFHTLPGDITVFIRERAGTGQLNGILVHDARVKRRPVTLMAESGALVQTSEGPRVVLVNGNRQEIDREDGTLSYLYFDKYTVDLGITGAAPTGARRRAPEEMFLWELFDPARADTADYREFVAEGHSRIAAPFLAVSFTAIGLAFLLSGDFSRRGQTGRIAGAVVAMVLIQTLAIAAHNAAGDNSAGIPLLYVNVLLPGIIGWLLLARGWRRSGPGPSGPGPEIGARA